MEALVDLPRDDDMRLNDLNFDPVQLADLCKRRQVARLELFGSFAGGNATPESDVDLLVTFEPDVRIGLLGFVELQEELESLVGRPVDLLTRDSVERSKNKYFRRFVLRRTEPLYERA